VITDRPEVTPEGGGPQVLRLGPARTFVAWSHQGGSEVIGNRRGSGLKNKCAPPFRTAEFDIATGEVSAERVRLDEASISGSRRKSGAWYTYEASSSARAVRMPNNSYGKVRAHDELHQRIRSS